ncbi:MAG: ABC transporter ATP-binding protein [Desulfobacterales bacterium]|jgi:oligopeptide/dipeptide ABC transporter ATP-binding protein|nr:ABC transporter ATP-binding protein [Desulfobacterales bacterium]
MLSIRHLKTYFRTPRGIARAVDGVSLQMGPGEIMGVVGESGCGKSVMALSVLGLLASPPALFAGGEIRFKGRDLLTLAPEELRRLRGDQISMIFQEPMSALNPVFTVGNQLSEVFRVHRGLDRSAARQGAVEMLAKVGVPAPERRVGEYPYQLSGGMRQRVMIAMALACRPALLLADEPTTALDVSIQAQILELMLGLKEELGTAILLITHDLGVVAEITRRVAVMYTGKIMEEAATEELFDHPLHPYTRGLMASIPRADASFETDALNEIRGVVPSAVDLPPGCHFEPRCPEAVAACRTHPPELEELRPGHRVACWRANRG